MQTDYDSKVDWTRFFETRLQGYKRVGDGEYAGICPFHNDKGPSLHVKVETGQWKCFGCDKSGNAWTFLQESGLSADDARAEIRKAAGEDPAPAAKRPAAKRAKLTVDGYAAAKHLPVEFLTDLGLKNARTGIAIPYVDEAGEVKATKMRYAEGAGVKFSWSKGSTIIPYGAFRMREIREIGTVVLVEGESDAQTCWHHGILNVLGVPGSAMFKAEWAPMFADLDVVIHREPGDGGEAFVKLICDRLARAQHSGKVRVFSMRGAKDPSASHIANADAFPAAWAASLEDAEEIDATRIAVDAQGVLPGAPVKLEIPEGWLVTQRGVVWVNPKDQSYVPVLPVPLLISRRLKSLDTGEEKVELAYMRDGAWQSITTKRSVAFTTRGIVDLADRGLPITSERARHVVRYLGELEAANMDTMPLARSVERMGWVGARKFIPGSGGDVVLDVPSGSEALAAAYHAHGELDEWLRLADVTRQRFVRARFMLAASLATPLLKQLRQRVFLVHFWGASRGGKTASLKLALSAWGDPDGLMATFNTTKVGMERLAAFYCDLPLGVDERQVIGKDQGLAEGLVYLLGAGKGKVRGAKDGGLQSMSSWRTIALTTGEEPLSKTSTSTGVKTRAVEVYGTPIDDENHAREIHRTIDKHYGHAGIEFVRQLVEYVDGGGDVDAEFNQIMSALEAVAPAHMVAHVSAVATICLADALASQWLWNVERGQAANDAVQMGAQILQEVATSNDADYGVRAKEWIEQWIGQHRNRFVDDGCPEPWGFVEHGIVWISPSALEPEMERAGFSSQRVLKDLAVSGSLWRDPEDPNGRLKRRQTWQGSRVWMVGFILDRGMPAESDPVIPESKPSDPADWSAGVRWDLEY